MDEDIGGRVEGFLGTDVVDSFYLSTSRSDVCSAVLWIVGDLVSDCVF